MSSPPDQTILRDPALFYWVLLPITVVMILTGVFRHYASVLVTADPKPPSTLPESRERLSLLHAINLRANASSALTAPALEQRKKQLIPKLKDGSFLKNRQSGKDAASPTGAAGASGTQTQSGGGGGGGGPANPMTDPAQMDAMMGMMKSNVIMMAPQTLILSWINALFSGYVLLRLPFPLTIRFKPMLQAGVLTRDLDPRWVSSISWYFLNLFGLSPVYSFFLGNNNAASQAATMGPVNPGIANPVAPGQDPNKSLTDEAENLQVMDHFCLLDGIEERLLDKEGVL